MKKAVTKMKKNILAAYITIIIGIIFMTVGIMSAADVTTPPEKVTIDNKVYKDDKKGAVEFSHLKHTKDYKATCTDCHHEYKDGKNIWKAGDAVKKCSACHDPENDQGNAKKLQTAYHNNCKDCHKKSGKDTAPSTKCNDCHAKS
jgi:hypothetical protein